MFDIIDGIDPDVRVDGHPICLREGSRGVAPPCERRLLDRSSSAASRTPRDPLSRPFGCVQPEPRLYMALYGFKSLAPPMSRRLKSFQTPRLPGISKTGSAWCRSIANFSAAMSSLALPEVHLEGHINKRDIEEHNLTTQRHTNTIFKRYEHASYTAIPI